ncbi:TetR family transcriptional regulator [Streptomyces sp. Tu 2975]|uniref:TetR/AcrR family transcriptional regulator n=1 Tax=Streptomyces sp. Tu 2975 TaxID=2676871 RepID=UPI001358EB6E|nr:TetR family transcriptional regulator [Streptomyces sp. Tu 2975]
MDAENKRRPGSHDPEGNRRAVLEAARRLFGAHGYKGVGIRAIAAEAGVTPGLVMAYFGTKDGLFREVVGGGTGVSEEVLSAAARDTDDLPGALARTYLDRWDRLPPQDPWPALIRSAVGHAPSAELLRTILEKQVGEPLTRLLGASPEAEVRAALVRSVLFGVIMERYLFAHEPAASVPTAALAPALADVLATAFGGAGALSSPLMPPPDASRPRRTCPEASRDEPLSGGLPAGSPDRETAPPFPEDDDSPSSLFAGLSDIAARHRTVLGRTVRAYGISLPAYHVLAALRDVGEPYRRTTGDVAAAVGGGPGGLTQHADRLEAAGLVRRERDRDDRRIVHLFLTPEGVELADRIRGVRADQERELLAGLSLAERRQLTVLLTALGRTLGAGVPER